jgi:hypothetical protein
LHLVGYILEYYLELTLFSTLAGCVKITYNFVTKANTLFAAVIITLRLRELHENLCCAEWNLLNSQNP